MSVEQSPSLSVPYLAERCGFCKDCALARTLGLEVAQAATPEEAADSRRVAESFAGYISLGCSRIVPFPEANDDPCTKVNEDRKCHHDDLRNLHGEGRATKIDELLERAV